METNIIMIKSIVIQNALTCFGDGGIYNFRLVSTVGWIKDEGRIHPTLISKKKALGFCLLKPNLI